MDKVLGELYDWLDEILGLWDEICKKLEVK